MVVADLVKRVWSFEQNVNLPLTKIAIWNLVKSCQVVSKVKLFTDYMIVYMFSAQGASADKFLLY